MNCPECGKDQERVRTHWEGCHEHHPECAAYKSGYEAGKKDGVEAGLRRASEICQLEKVDAESTNEDADGAYNLAITHCTETILSAIGGGK